MYKQYDLQEFARLPKYFQPYYLSEDSSFIHKNVIGYIPANNEANIDGPYVILSAHFDHIGISRYPVDGDSIFNGADDNASGIVTLLTIAKNLCEREVRPDCPIVFAAFSNEERGMRGSSYFCKSEIIPIQQIKVVVNFEMLSHSEEFGKHKYYITGPDYSNLQDIVMEFNENKEWKIAKPGNIVNMLYRMSDNYSFVIQANSASFCVSAHTIATSVGLQSHVHKVYDEIDFVDFENMNSVVENLTQLVIYLASKQVAINCKKK
jgi:Zn-dependent M28 family amino/carboxypeptidase